MTIGKISRLNGSKIGSRRILNLIIHTRNCAFFVLQAQKVIAAGKAAITKTVSTG
jgi:hypothetical protein